MRGCSAAEVPLDFFYYKVCLLDVGDHHPANNPIKPSNETVAKSDVDGKRKGLIFPFNATDALNKDKVAVTIVKNTTNSGRSGCNAT